MSISFLGASVQGASHKRAGLPCQDNFAIRDRSFQYHRDTPRNAFYSGMGEDVWILSAADGHGSSACPYSENGSRLAVNTFCDVMAEFCFKYRQDMEALYLQLKRESEVIHFMRAIEIEWKARVLRDYNTNKRKHPPITNPDKDDQKAAIYKLYGTTLLGMLITDNFVFAYQLGDGDINFIDHTTVLPLVEQEKILGVETHSLAKIGAWKNAHSSIFSREDERKKPYMYMLSTDGMINSFVSNEEFYKSCQGYLSSLEEHGLDVVRGSLPSWLNQTSEGGCGDDITVVIAYFDSSSSESS